MAAGEVELPEFFQIMTMTREAEAEATFWGDDFGGDESISESSKFAMLEERAPFPKYPMSVSWRSAHLKCWLPGEYHSLWARASMPHIMMAVGSLTSPSCSAHWESTWQSCSGALAPCPI